MSERQPGGSRRPWHAALAWLDQVPLLVLLLMALTLGLAPFQPEPHLLQKLRLLVQGELVKPIDVFDLCLHATPWLLLGLRVSRQQRRRR
jgi:hypothetical protein